MINLALRTEYSFKQCYGFLNDVVGGAQTAVGIADEANTFGHVKLQKICKAASIKPIFGIRLMVINKQLPKTKQWGPKYIFIAKSQSGLMEIYALVRKAYDRFYYHPHATVGDIIGLSDHVIVIATNFQRIDRIDYIGLTHTTPRWLLEYELPKVAINTNWYPSSQDKQIYQLHVGTRMMEEQTYPQHILNEAEWFRIWGDQEAIDNTYRIAEQCDVKLPTAPMVRYQGKLSIRNLCKAGARKRKIDLKDPQYKLRLERELKLIHEKDYEDYFLIVADMVRKAKCKMLVGPSRGSSAGSLVCYLCEITEVDPIRFGLLFERFIDINRADLPDIDIDFPDRKRDVVIKALVDTYGPTKVSHIGTVSTMKPKSAIGNFAAGLCIPTYETDEVKGAIISRSGGDARAMMCIEDTFRSTEVGRNFIEKYPDMEIVKNIEGHASHSGVHAAGIIVSSQPLSCYGGVSTRDDALMMNKKDAETLDLLKIDCLGLRTLSILESVADQIGMKYSDYYNLPLDDKNVFAIFNNLRLSGIFQFQGNALQYVTRQMGVGSFDDIAAITALARPGPIHSGGTNIFIGRKTGAEDIEYLSEDPAVVRNTEDTLGVIIYQEQLMTIGREYGDLSWEDVSELRKAASQSLGEEFFNKYKENFMRGARQRGMDEKEAINVWENMVTFGSWGFNKSHAYSYGLISYWTAWAKVYHPLEFAVANLNHARSDSSALKILRDLVRNDELEYIAIDADESLAKWSVNKDGKLLGGLLSIKGIGPAKANAIIKARSGKGKWTPSMVKTLMNPNTIFNILFPCEHYWGDIFANPNNYGLTEPPVPIETISKAGSHLFIGKLVDVNLRDLNETMSVVKRGGRLVEDHTLFLNLILEDDTDSIVVTINRYRYEEIGRHIAETGKVDEDWFLVRGNIKDKWRRVDVEAILNLNTWAKADMASNPAPTT